MSSIELHTAGQSPVQIDYEAILRTLQLNPSDPNAQALLVVCDRYGLDPILKQAVLIQGRLYVTRDGLLAVAHRSGQFDGIEVLDQAETDTHYTAKVSVYRRDMSRPFTYIGRYPKAGGNRGYGPEMAVKCAEVMALRRAFNVTGIAAREEQWDLDVESEPVASRPAIEAQSQPDLITAKGAKGRLLFAVRAAGWQYAETDPGHPASDCPAVLEAIRLWNGLGDESISEGDLAALIAAVQPPAGDDDPDGKPFDETNGDGYPPQPAPEEGSGGPGDQVDTRATGSPTTTPPQDLQGRAGQEPSPPASGPSDRGDIPTARSALQDRTVTAKQASQLHRDLGRKVESDGYGLGKADQEDLIYVVTKGRTTHASELTLAEDAVVRQYAGYLRTGEKTLADLHRVAEEHRTTTLETQLEQSIAQQEESAAVRDFDERTTTRRAS